jgi:hypothetical protein
MSALELPRVAEYATSNLTTGGGTSYLTMDTLGTPRQLCCKNYFEVRNFFERISLGSNLK